MKVLKQFKEIKITKGIINKEVVEEKIRELQEKLVKQVDDFAGAPFVIGELQALIDAVNKELEEATEDAKEQLTSKLATATMQMNQYKATMEYNQRYIAFYEEMIMGFKELLKVI